MGLDNVRENILKNAESKMKSLQLERALEIEARTLIKMGDDFCRATNYSIGFYQYFRALKKLSLLFLKKKLGNVEGMSEDDALSLVAEKKFFGFDIKDYEKMKKLNEKIINRKEVLSKNSLWMKKIIKEAIKKIS